MSKSIVIVGGGAAGVFAGIRAAHVAHSEGKDIRVTILEASSSPLKKVRISGGGRCNVTHNCFEVRKFCENYPRGSKELRSPMQNFQAQDTVDWFLERGVDVVSESDGRMFPITNTSDTIIDCFKSEMEKWKVRLLTGHPVQEIEKCSDGFQLNIKGQPSVEAQRLLIATGSSPRGYELATSLGHQITERAPSLFSFKIQSPLIQGLEGLSFDNCKVQLTPEGGRSFRDEGPVLITHWGLSGPAILKLSAWAAREMKTASYKAQLQVRWVEDAASLFGKVKEEKPKSLLKNVSPEALPKRFWQSLLSFTGVDGEKRWADFSKKDYNLLFESLHNCKLDVLGQNRFKDEFVECGGVALKEVSFKSMESKICDHLYFAGELLDVDGVTGGFNFQNAWTTGWLAGSHMATTI